MGLLCCCGTTCQPFKVTVLDCDGTTPLAGASVTATKGGTTVGPVTTNGSGIAFLPLDSSGSWTVTAVKGGLISAGRTITFVCAATGQTTTLTLFYCDSLGWPGPKTLTTGGQTIAFSGSTASGNFPASAFDVNTCAPAATVNVLFGITCVGHCVVAVGYTVQTVNCGGTQLVKAGQTGFLTANVNASVTSYTQSPFSIAGTWLGYTTGSPPPAMPVTGGFTIS